ncbi:MAG: sugar ABC transporter permease [Lachnospiraceae bacterium]|nr:sugar ABC transporter permease [Lachnospiraceae bacterium]MDE6601419.1 sugar ABC transporter permease [Lachnospiraceae bacterium]MDE7358547.1 sugar ABC transporter permease [Lachnospiraceae bacterium]
MNKALEIFRKHTMKIVLVLIVIFFSVMTKGQMFAASSFQALIAQNAYVFVLATGMLMCMLTGGNIDLSVGSFVCFIGAIGGIMMVRGGMSVPLAMLLMVGAGVIYGVVEGFLIAYLNIPPWIATLAGYLAFRGWGTALLSGATIAPMPEGFIKMFNGSVPDLFGGAGLNITCILVGVIACALFVVLQLKGRNDKVKKGYEAESMTGVIVRCVLVSAVILLFAFKLAQAGGIPNNLIWVAVIVLIYNFITGKTTIGRYFYTIGGNVEATKLSGIDTKKIFFLAYLNMAVLTVVSAWMTMARLSAATPTAGTNYEMDAISACVVGGVSAYGGSGTVFGMVVGATLIGVINLGMSLMGIDANWQRVVKGVVLLAAVVFEIMNNKEKTKE